MYYKFLWLQEYEFSLFSASGAQRHTPRKSISSCMPLLMYAKLFFFCCYTVLFSGHNCLFSCIFLFNGSMCQVNFGWKNKQMNINQNSSAIFKKKNYEKKSLQKSHATLSSTLTEDL